MDSLPDTLSPTRGAIYVGQVYNGGSMPTTVPAWYLTHPIAVSGTEAEGNPLTITPDTTRSTPVLVIGPHAPIVGTNLIARLQDGIWVAEHGIGCRGTITVTVHGCGGLVVAGATVSITGPGSFSASGTTDSSGQYSVAITKAGSYSINTTKSPRFGLSVVNLNATCTDNAVSVTLISAINYVCCGACAEPIPTVLAITDSVGLGFTLNHQVGTSIWTGGINHSHTGIRLDSYGNCIQTSSTINVTYTLKCPATAGAAWTLSQDFIYVETDAAGCCPNTPALTCYSSAAANAGDGWPSGCAQSISGKLFTDTTVSAATDLAPSCTPLNLSFSFSGSDPCHVIESGTVTVTE